MADIQLTADDHGTVFVVKGGHAALPDPTSVDPGFYARFMLKGDGPFQISYTRTLIGAKTTTLTLEDNGSWAEVRPTADTWLVLTGIRDKVVGPPGPEGPPGPPGPAPTLTIGQVEEGQVAAASLGGTAENPTLNLVLPKAGPGPRGPAPNLTIGQVTQGEAAATITGTPENPRLNLTLPKGDVGPAPTLTIGQVQAGDDAAATITGPSDALVLNLTLPRGPQGEPGPAGGSGGSGPLPPATLGQTLNMTASGWKAVDTPPKVAAYVQSRGNSLVTNGYGTLGNNTNFRHFTFDPADCVVGGGSFDRVGVNSDVTLDELIPVDPEGQYTVSFYAKTKTKAGASKAYFYVSCQDIDGDAITPINLPLFHFTVAEEITSAKNYLVVASEDRQRVHDEIDRFNLLTSGSMWVGSAEYTSNTGFVYPTGTYTRTFYSRNNQGTSTTYDKNTGRWSGLNFSSLSQGVPPGSKVCICRSGGTYLYLMSDLANKVIPNEWTKYQVTFNAKDNLRPATAYIKLGFLMNRESQVANRQSVSAVSLTRNEQTTYRHYRLPARHSPGGITLVCSVGPQYLYYTAICRQDAWGPTFNHPEFSPPEFPPDLVPTDGYFVIGMRGHGQTEGQVVYQGGKLSFYKVVDYPPKGDVVGRTPLMQAPTPSPRIPADWVQYPDLTQALG